MVPRRTIPSSQTFDETKGTLAGALTKQIVPIFGRRAQTEDGGMESVHTLRHSVAGGIGVKAAVDR